MHQSVEMSLLTNFSLALKCRCVSTEFFLYFKILSDRSVLHVTDLPNEDVISLP